jgi:hypothetical protein
MGWIEAQRKANPIDALVIKALLHASTLLI